MSLALAIGIAALLILNSHIERKRDEYTASALYVATAVFVLTMHSYLGWLL